MTQLGVRVHGITIETECMVSTDSVAQTQTLFMIEMNDAFEAFEGYYCFCLVRTNN